MVKEVDLTPLKKRLNSIVSDSPLELKLIEFYTLEHTLETKSTFERFTNYVLEHMFRGPGDYTYNDIGIFFSKKRYLSIVESFMALFECLLYNQIPIRVSSVEFVKFIDTDSKLIAEFKYDKENI